MTFKSALHVPPLVKPARALQLVPVATLLLISPIFTSGGAIQVAMLDCALLTTSAKLAMPPSFRH